MTGTAGEGAPLLFRDARPDDWPEIAALHAASWRAAYRGILSDRYLDGPVDEDRRAVWRERFSGSVPRRVVVLAFDPGTAQPVGFACIFAGHDPRWGALIDNLHVRPGATRKRIGRRVLGEAAARLDLAAAAEPIHLTVYEENRPARHAYESWGGRIVEHMRVPEPDGRDHPVVRYAWENPAALLGRLRDA